MPQFAHLHCHTQFSLLDGAASIPALFKKAKADGMPALAITDHGNMFGVFQFVAEAAKHEGVKPIVGCEFYVVQDRHRRTFTKEDKDKRYHQLFLAKNPEGYKNLVKLCSLGYIEGLYGKYPRIDKELILQYHEGLIATSCCIGAMVPQAILRKGEAEAKKEFEWWLDLFGEDYYIEIQRHQMPEQDQVNEVLLRWSKEYNVKTICTNDSHYVDQKDWNAHDILLCVNTGEKQATPAIREFVEEGTVMKGGRFAFWNDQFYFKTQAEMGALFKDVPQALDNTLEIVDKCEHLKLKKDILLPNFIIPDGYQTQDDYLRHLTFEGARKRYKEITPEIEERLNFELHTVKTMGFAGYFLIVADFIEAGRDLGVFIGPGRGSAAGSAVAYCIGITNIDPIKYQLLFERFLNPDRKSMPDIDTDFDDEGRQKVIDYVVDKYGKQQVAQIVTYGTMAAKMSIKDVARVLDLPLDQANALAKLVPEKPGISLNRILTAPLDGEGSLREKEGLMTEDIENVKRLREFLAAGDTSEGTVLKEAKVLEGSVRGTGIHAAGIIIAPKDLTEIIPVFTSKETELLITQYEGSIIEEAGVIKMDFLGLKTLTIIRDALKLIKQNHGIDIDIDSIPLDDPQTYELYQRGETNGTFQFESAGMQKYLRDLKPDKFDDLIAMNALYRPGPLEYIPDFIARKHGRQQVTYDLPDMEEYLKDTFGICVYQEQIMLLSQKLAGFSKGDADVLRKAMGKKQKAVLDKMKSQFVEGAVAKGHPADKLEKIWTDWEAFASYAFNKSHSTCYAFVAYQTAYLKAHYPSEYMAAVLTHSQSNIEKITFFLEECKRMGLTVKGPDVNESLVNFSVNKKGEIRYGMGAIKGVGEAAVEVLIAERDANGAFKDIYDFMRRVSLRVVNKRVMESLVFAGAFDSFENTSTAPGKPALHRAAFFQPTDKYESFIENLLKYGAAYQEEKVMSANSLFGDLSETVGIAEPTVPKAETWNLVLKLQKEKDVVGLYLSGHPLDDFRYEWENFATPIANVESYKGRKVNVAGFVLKAEHRISQKGTGWGRFTLQDYTGSLEITMFSETYAKFKSFFEEGTSVYVEGEYKQRYNSDEMEFRVLNVRLLETVGEEKTQSVTLRIPVERISADMIAQIEKLCAAHKGKHTLRMELIDYTNKEKMAFTSLGKKVNVGNELIAGLEGLGVECGVN
ncbi:MAG: DNA polymerase III subunit alpha [Haliscomenobacteraceae bacterium CHB4]|nr:DNA polymerase III subunit alpha [Saprospiraceae bacterium]MCE7922683.1 DNA polymerase III subunit alpha [Haliscomenobacteraceae bacterium CHB4]